jgi:hypothetical protein
MSESRIWENVYGNGTIPYTFYFPMVVARSELREQESYPGYVRVDAVLLQS